MKFPIIKVGGFPFYVVLLICFIKVSISISCAANYFVNSSGVCQICSIAYCQTCQSLTSCQTCNSTATVRLSSKKLCYLCSPANCISCSSTNVCEKCVTGYYVNLGLCSLCSQSCTCYGWVLPKNALGVCSTICGDGILKGTEECDDGNTVSHDGCSSTCTKQTCAQNCSCDGWVKPWLTNSCLTTCGDGLLRGSQECDDNNTISHDGCSSTCLKQNCSQSCKCDGWIAPWINKTCSTYCGDSKVRGQQTCDDGNNLNFDGCSSTCQIQACSVSCLCDGWVNPRFNNSCSTICGDKFVRGQQKCDQGNMNGLNDCSSQCKLQQLILIQQSLTIYPLLCLYLFGFKVIGIQMLNIIQNFQLILQTYDLKKIQFAYQIHGYSNANFFPLQIASNINIFSHFNVIFMNILIFSLIFIIIEIYIWKKSVQIQNNGLSNDKQCQNSKSQENSSNEQTQQKSSIQSRTQDDNFVVHHKKQVQVVKFKKSSKKIRITKFPMKPSLLLWICPIISRQLFFNQIINSLSIIIFSICQQISLYQFQSIGYKEIIALSIIVGLLVGFIIFYRKESVLFGENQLKFNNSKWMTYWILIISEKITFSILLGLKLNGALWILAALKMLIVIYFIMDNVFFHKIQNFRNIIVNFLHLLLILITIFNINYFRGSQMNLYSPLFIIQYIELSIVGLIILITFGFYIRQILFKCSADERSKLFIEICLTEANTQNQYQLNQKKLQSGSPLVGQMFDFKLKNVFDDTQKTQKQQNQQYTQNASQFNQTNDKLIKDNLIQQPKIQKPALKINVKAHKRNLEKTINFQPIPLQCQSPAQKTDSQLNINISLVTQQKKKHFLKSFRRVGLQSKSKAITQIENGTKQQRQKMKTNNKLEKKQELNNKKGPKSVRNMIQFNKRAEKQQQDNMSIELQ